MMDWLNILAGLILCVGIFEALPVMGKHIDKFAKWLGGFDTIIGIIIIIYVIWTGNWNTILGIVAIFAGLIMIVGILPLIPAIGKHLDVLIVGILGLTSNI
jgi:hypothetical protein